jgi:hypothetical protein
MKMRTRPCCTIFFCHWRICCRSTVRAIGISRVIPIRIARARLSAAVNKFSLRTALWSWGRGREFFSANSTGHEAGKSISKSAANKIPVTLTEPYLIGQAGQEICAKKRRGGGTGWGGDRWTTLPRRGL